MTGGCPLGQGVSRSVPVRPKPHSVIFSVCHKQKQARVVRNVPKMSQRKHWVHPGLIAYPALGAAGLAQPRDGVATGGKGGRQGPKPSRMGLGAGRTGATSASVAALCPPPERCIPSSLPAPQQWAGPDQGAAAEAWRVMTLLGGGRLVGAWEG